MNKYDDITYKVNGCAMKVYNYFGNGFQGVIYKRCLAIKHLNPVNPKIK